MKSSDQDKTPKIDWKKKGLGWIPDYPDLRDYQPTDKDIQENGRIKREEGTREIEAISEYFLKIIKFLPKEFIPKQGELKEQISNFEDKIFGNIRFVNVKIYKILRKQVQSDENPKVPSDSEISKQIIDLKKYLSLLIMWKKSDLKLEKLEREKQKKLKEIIGFNPNQREEENSGEEVDFEMFNDPTKVFSWLGQGDFDSTTKFLVMLFQRCSGIPGDGVVGLETYTTFNEYLCNRENLKKLEADIKVLGEESKLPEINFSRKTKLILVPSLIPPPLLNVVFENLKSIDNLNKSIDKFTIDLFKKSFKELEEKKSPYLERLEQFLDKSPKDKDYLTSKKFKEVFYNEFSVIEPIVSFVIKFMSPLAQLRNIPLEKVVPDALQIAKAFFDNAYPETNKLDDSKTSLNINSSNISFKSVEMEELSKEVLRSGEMQKLAKEALQKVTITIEDEINLTIEDEIKQLIQENLNIQKKQTSQIEEKIIPKLCFYFLFKKFLNQFIKPAEQCKVLDKRQATIFDKQELFELEESPIWQQVNNNTPCETKLELFARPKLQIPVSSSLINSLQSSPLDNEQNLKPYFFLPSVVDLTYWDSPIEDQGSLQSCTAFAGVALIEYFANRSRGKSTDLSPLFLYKAARNLMSLNGDVGASVRETMKAMALFGVPPEQYWTYEEDKVNEEPPPFCYSYAQNFQSLKYFRLDYADMSREVLLSQIKAVLAAGFPCMFGFTVYTSAYGTFNLSKGYIPFPSGKKDRLVGGHAVVAVGYDDLQTIAHADRTSVSQGAFLIRNSWGTDWGKEGYGWIPYDYVLQGLTRDWWSLLKSEWFDEDNFGLGARNIGGLEPPPNGVPGGETPEKDDTKKSSP